MDMQYDVIFVSGETFFDHPLSGVAIIKRLFEKYSYSVGIIEMPTKEEDIAKLGKPKLFFAVSSGSIDSMVRNYTPLKKLRIDDKNLNYNETVPDRAVIVYCNWIRKQFKGSTMVIGGVEASLRRFVHYDYWDNKLRKPILLDSRADVLVYGSAEKQMLEIAARIKEGKDLNGIAGTCIVAKEVPPGFSQMPSFDEVSTSKEKLCDMQNMLTNSKNLSQRIDNRHVLQYKSPIYKPADLDEYYELPFTRKCPKMLRGFEFSVVTHRGCMGNCNFCSITLTQGTKIISRSEDSIVREIERIVKMPHFQGNIDDLGGPSANMYGMDNGINEESNKGMIGLLRRVRSIPGVKNVYIKSGVRYDLTTPEYIREVAAHHIFDTLRIAPEHVDENVLKLMNKSTKPGSLQKFMEEFRKTGTKKDLSFYFMTAHPGSTMKEAERLASTLRKLKHAECVQVFTPTPMTVSTAMYYTGMDPKTKKKVYVPYTYSEKKKQKRIIFGNEPKENFLM